MTRERLTKAALRRAIRAMALELADAVVDMVEAEGLWDEPPAEEDAELAAPRVRRSPADLERCMDRIVAAVEEAAAPVAIGAIAERLGTSSRQIAHPMARLVEEGRVVRTGARRGARYEVPRGKRRASPDGTVREPRARPPRRRRRAPG